MPFFVAAEPTRPVELPGVHIAKSLIIAPNNTFCFCRWQKTRLVRREESDVRFALRAPTLFVCFLCVGEWLLRPGGLGRGRPAKRLGRSAARGGGGPAPPP
eukprot:COSAG06_NODE_18238_length_897_cov_0.838346_1_plen_100_part_10